MHWLDKFKKCVHVKGLVSVVSLTTAVCLLLVSPGCGSQSSATATPWSGTRLLGAVGVLTDATGVTSDSSSNVYVTGNTEGGLDGNTLTGGADFFVTKYNSSGVKQWTRQLGVAGVGTWSNCITSDSSSNVYVAGYTQGGLDGNTLTGTDDLFLTKYDSSGVKQWTRQLGVAGSTRGVGITLDSLSNIYIAGYTQGGLDGNTLTGTQDFFVTKYNSSGVKQWTRQLGVSGVSTTAYSITSDSSSNVYVTGNVQGGLDGNTLTGVNDFFVTKYNSSGVKQWTRQLGVAGTSTFSRGITSDSSSNVYVAGYTQGGLDGNTLTGTRDFFVTKYNSSGVKQWTRQLGVAGTGTSAFGITSDSSSNVYVTGDTRGDLDGNTTTGARDFFVTKYNSSGVKQWTRLFGGPSDTWGKAITSDSSSNVYVAGYTNDDLDGNPLTGITDSFVTKYTSSGVKQ